MEQIFYSISCKIKSIQFVILEKKTYFFNIHCYFGIHCCNSLISDCNKHFAILMQFSPLEK